MIGRLPDTLTVNEKEYAIDTDFRTALTIFEAFNDSELSEYEKAEVCLQCIYSEEIPPDKQAALNQAAWYLDGGDMPKSKQSPVKIMDWDYDQSIIFPAVNKVAGYETRTCEYLHWWSFLGLFNEIGDGLYAQVMNIRSKKAKNKKLEKHEKEFYKEHKNLVDIKEKPTAEDIEEQEFIKSLIGE